MALRVRGADRLWIKAWSASSSKHFSMKTSQCACRLQNTFHCMFKLLRIFKAYISVQSTSYKSNTMYKTKLVTCWVSCHMPFQKHEILDLFLVDAQFQALTNKSTDSAIICNHYSTLVHNTAVMAIQVIMLSQPAHTQGKCLSHNNILAPPTSTSSTHGKHHISGHRDMSTSARLHLFARNICMKVLAQTNAVTLQETCQHITQNMN